MIFVSTLSSVERQALERMTLRAHHPQLELIYLLKFSGHRDNPVEKLWWHLKCYTAANRCCRSMEELITVVTRYLDSLTSDRVFQFAA